MSYRRMKWIRYYLKLALSKTVAWKHNTLGNISFGFLTSKNNWCTNFIFDLTTAFWYSIVYSFRNVPKFFRITIVTYSNYIINIVHSKSWSTMPLKADPSYDLSQRQLEMRPSSHSTIFQGRITNFLSNKYTLRRKNYRKLLCCE